MRRPASRAPPPRRASASSSSRPTSPRPRSRGASGSRRAGPPRLPGGGASPGRSSGRSGPRSRTRVPVGFACVPAGRPGRGREHPRPSLRRPRRAALEGLRPRRLHVASACSPARRRRRSRTSSDAVARRRRRRRRGRRTRARPPRPCRPRSGRRRDHLRALIQGSARPASPLRLAYHRGRGGNERTGTGLPADLLGQSHSGPARVDRRSSSRSSRSSPPTPVSDDTATQDTKAQIASEKSGQEAGPENPRTYTVEEGDTLGAIAEKFNVSTKRLERLNPDIDPQTLNAGQELQIRVDARRRGPIAARRSRRADCRRSRLSALAAFALASDRGAAPAAQGSGGAPGRRSDAATWLLLDPSDGQELAAHDPDKERAIASTTKLMTAYLALKKLSMKREARGARLLAGAGGVGGRPDEGREADRPRSADGDDAAERQRRRRHRRRRGRRLAEGLRRAR